jgi:cysteine-rich repeat protein
VGYVGCSSECQLEYFCTTEYCGNGVRDGEEECDGSDVGDSSCLDYGGGEGQLLCNYQCGFDFTNCTNVCGNGVLDGDEGCDGSDFGGQTCADYGGTTAEGHLTCAGCSIDPSACNPDPPDCDTIAETHEVPPVDGGNPGRIETCQVDAHPAKEISTKIEVCGNAIPDGPDSCGTDPATSGTANIFVPDLDTTIGSVYFTTTGIQVQDPDADGLPKPGHTVLMTIPLINAGFGTATNVHAVLSSPAYDIDGDGTPDPVSITQPASDYPGAPCFVGLPSGTVDCDAPAVPPVACANLTPFVVTFPDGHPADVAREFNLTITYDESALGSSTQFTTPFVIGIAGIPTITCGNSLLELGEDCDDGNTDDGDCCSSLCLFESAGAPCPDDNDLCTADACDGGATCLHPDISASCDDGNPCTGDSCDPGSGCQHANVGGTCDDGDPCSLTDACSGGQCVGTGALACNDGNICTNDSCVTGVGCSYVNNNTCGANPKGQGYWKRICAAPHASGEFISPVDVECVNDTCTFDDVHTVASLCTVMTPNPPNDKCKKAESHFMTLLLNVCRGRVGRYEATQSSCGNNTDVDEAIHDADALLCSPARNHATCVAAQCESEEINNGKALGVTSLRVTATGNGPVTLTWGPPYTDSDSLSTIRYRVWRRVNSNVAFTQLTETPSLAFTDTTASGTTYQYEVTVVW